MGGCVEELIPVDTQQHRHGTRGILESLLRFFALLSGIVLLGIMLLVAWAVFTRYILNNPILGDQELVEIGMALVVMLAMPFATYSGAHIRVDILDRRIGALGRYSGDLLSRVLGAYILYLLIGKTWDKAWDAHKYNDVTNMIEIPVWIAYGAITLGMGLFALLLVGQAIRQIFQGMTGYE